MDNFVTEAFSFSPQAVEQMLNFLSGNNTQPIETTQLQILCNRCEQLAQQYFQQTTKPALITPEFIPDFDNIFIDFYSGILDKLPPADREKAENFVENELIKREQRIPLDRLVCSDFVSETVLNHMVNNHLLRVEQNTTGGTSYELAHDTLVQPILQVRNIHLQKKEELRAEAERREELRLANLRAEQEKAERQKDRKRQRRIIYIVSVAAVVSIAFGIFGFVNMRIAQKNSKIAIEKTKIAEEALNEIKVQQVKNLIQKAKNYRIFGEDEYAKQTLLEALAIDSANVEVKEMLTKPFGF